MRISGRGFPWLGGLVALGLLTGGLAGCGQPAAAPTAAAPSVPVAAAVTFAEQPALAKDVAALPRLVGTTPAIAAINADLDKMDAETRDNVRDCATQAGNDGGGWTQWVTRPMTGLGYVTLRSHTDVYCGGAYPSNGQIAVTYDLATGQRLDWAAAIPGLSLTVDALDDMPSGYVSSVRSAALAAWYSRKMLAATDKEWVDQCREVFDPEQMAEQGFRIWPSAEGGGVAVEAELPHVAQACADTAILTADDLRSFNAQPRLIAALAAAHAAGNWSPKE